MPIQTNFTYNNLNYLFYYNNNDASGPGGLEEIIRNNEYSLENYSGLINKHIIDIGGNCGIATLILAKQNPESIIYVFEPDTIVYNILQKNIEENNLKNVKSFNLAVTKPGIKNINLFKTNTYSGGNTSCANEDIINNINSFDKDNTSQVNCISLNEIINIHNIDSIELLKIDCEGAEYDIIYNFSEIEKGFIKNIVGEYHNLYYNNMFSIEASIKLLEYTKKYVNGRINITSLTIDINKNIKGEHYNRLSII